MPLFLLSQFRICHKYTTIFCIMSYIKTLYTFSFFNVGIGCVAGFGAIVSLAALPRCQWSRREDYGWNWTTAPRYSTQWKRENHVVIPEKFCTLPGTFITWMWLSSSPYITLCNAILASGGNYSHLPLAYAYQQHKYLAPGLSITIVWCSGFELNILSPRQNGRILTGDFQMNSI